MEALINGQLARKELLEKFISNYKKDGAERRTLQYYKKRLRDFQALFDQIQNAHIEILIAKETELPTSEILKHQYLKKDQYSQIEEFFYTNYAEIENRCEKEYPVKEPGQWEQRTSDSNVTIKKTSDESALVKLPKISLDKFAGDYQKWVTFRDLFKSLIHDNATLSNAQKLKYLKLHLVGEAENLLRHVQVSNDNYESAWKILKDRYDNKRVLVNTQLKRFFSQHPLINESSQGMKGLLDVTSECLQALRNLSIDVTTWDTMIVYIVVQKLPAETHQLWEQSISKEKDLPSWQRLQEFLEGRFRTLEAVAQRRPTTSKDFRPAPPRPRNTSHTCHVTTKSICVYCLKNHSIRQCQRFITLSTSQKLEVAKDKGLCLNCLGQGHLVAQCPSQHRCNSCHQRHHSLLHRKTDDSNSISTPSNHPNRNSLAISERQRQSLSITSNISQPQQHHHSELSPTASSFHSNHSSSPSCNLNSLTGNSNSKSQVHYVLLATALVKLQSATGNELLVRALIDQGSQVSLITEAVVQKLKLKREPIRANVSGIGQTNAGEVKAQVHLTLKSQYQDEFSINMNALVLRTLTNVLPSREICNKEWHHINQLQLADPWYYRPAKIDMLLGADIYGQILRSGLISGNQGTPVAQETALGWILSREFRIPYPPSDYTFWELEEIHNDKQLTKEEQRCEEIFQKTHKRRADGRYEVELPFSEENPSLGTSRQRAVSCLFRSETRLKRNPNLKTQYNECLKEYITLNHMEPIELKETSYTTSQDTNLCCYLPHHSVVKEDSTTTKVRVVFNASAPTSSGVSLNDVLLNGSPQQPDLYSILLRWRIHRIAFTADIAKMYRQIRIANRHADYQRIVWRESTQTPVRDFRLLTVTFGTKSAPYLATRVLKQLALDEQSTYPVGSAATLTDFYVDDLMSGAHTIDAAIEKQQQLRNLMNSGGFSLRKWVTNSQEVLATIPDELREMDSSFIINTQDNVKTLGIYWNPKTDTLSYSLKKGIQVDKITKRSLLSEISKLFDPLGWVSPVIIPAKIMIQRLWLEKMDWDDVPSVEIQSDWNKYQKELSNIDQISVPRWINIVDEHTKVEIHGFSDASLQAYAAVIYICTIHNGERKVNILTAKTKVAPIKAVSLPRLELCGAALLAKLISCIKRTLKTSDDTPVFTWTDSEIVQAWLNGHPSKWKSFIANRVSLIHDLLGEAVWGHVPSKENPADCATRGLSPSELKDFKLWWQGPEWLKKSKVYWPTAKLSRTTELEMRKQKQYCVNLTGEDDILQRYSSLTRLLRVTAYCKRFINECRKQPRNRSKDYLTNIELKDALSTILKIVQRKHFQEEIKQLTRRQEISNKSSLLKLTPFLDSDGILRVGGRLKHSGLQYDEKHPIILPDKDPFTKLIIDKYHRETLHGGPQLTMNVILRRYWILNARSTIRHQIHKCIPCYKQKAATQQQLMGDLPYARVRMSRPFSHTGIDYCGPFELKNHKGRGSKKYKGYVAIFVCMATKALHIETVTDLSAQGFIAAYRRFVSRRGMCSDIYCDCGSNFVGANRILTRQVAQMITELNMEIASLLETEGVNFHFIPPAAPHFGGLWESGVRSTKHHMKRILGNATLTYEEFATVLTQIEACLNSRPLCEISSDPEDVNH